MSLNSIQRGDPQGALVGAFWNRWDSRVRPPSTRLGVHEEGAVAELDPVRRDSRLTGDSPDEPGVDLALPRTLVPDSLSLSSPSRGGTRPAKSAAARAGCSGARPSAIGSNTIASLPSRATTTAWLMSLNERLAYSRRIAQLEVADLEDRDQRAGPEPLPHRVEGHRRADVEVDAPAPVQGAADLAQVGAARHVHEAVVLEAEVADVLCGGSGAVERMPDRHRACGTRAVDPAERHAGDQLRDEGERAHVRPPSCPESAAM